LDLLLLQETTNSTIHIGKGLAIICQPFNLTLYILRKNVYNNYERSIYEKIYNIC